MARKQFARIDWASVDDIDAALDHFKALAPALDSNIAHARAFQQRLVEAYSSTLEEQKLPVPQRVAIIVGLTGALWMIVGAVIFAVLYAYPQFAS